MINGIRDAKRSYTIVWFLSFRLSERSVKTKSISYPVNPACPAQFSGVDPVWLFLINCTAEITQNVPQQGRRTVLGTKRVKSVFQ